MTPGEFDRLGLIERKISDMRIDLSKILQRLDREVDPDSDDHEERLRKIEFKAHAAWGAIAILGALGLWDRLADLLK